MAFYSAKDIPGKNNFMPLGLLFVSVEEEIFCSNQVKFNGQPVGVIVADSINLASYAADFVEIIYEDQGTRYFKDYDIFKLKLNFLEKQSITLPTLKEVLNSTNDESNRIFVNESFGNAEENDKLNLKHKISGHLELGGQYHFHLETQTCIAVPTEDGLDVFSSTQWIEPTQVAIAECLKMPNNYINMTVRRLGGGFGAKLSRSAQIACGAALPAFLLNRPVRFVMSLEQNMTVVGKRYGCISDYEVDVDQNGLIQKFNSKYAQDYGCSSNEGVADLTQMFYNNCYNGKHFKVTKNGVLTDSASNTWMRAPGSLEATAMIENVMEHIARKVDKDPFDVKMTNMEENSKLMQIFPEFVDSVGEII